MLDQHSNFAASTVATAPSPATTGLTLVVGSGDGALFSTPPFNAVVCPAGSLPINPNAEIVRVTGVSGDTMTIVRGPQAGDPGGINRAIVVGDQLFEAITRKTFTDVESLVSSTTYPASSLQNGVVGAGDCALSATSVDSGTGVFTYTLSAANPLWVLSAAGVLTPVNFAGVTGGTFTPPILPANSKFRGYGLEIDTSGAVSIVTAAALDATSAAMALANLEPVVNGGAADTTAGRVRVADVVIERVAGVYSTSSAWSRDRRPWARGGYGRILRTGGSITASSSPLIAIDSTNLSMRLECSGAPVRFAFRARAAGVTASYAMSIGIFVDGALPDGATTASWATPEIQNTPYELPAIAPSWDFQPVAGSHLFQPCWSTGGVSVTLVGTSAQPLQFVIQEILQTNGFNGTT